MVREASGAAACHREAPVASALPDGGRTNRGRAAFDGTSKPIVVEASRCDVKHAELRYFWSVSGDASLSADALVVVAGVFGILR
jgi:hypothetical protein